MLAAKHQCATVACCWRFLPWLAGCLVAGCPLVAMCAWCRRLAVLPAAALQVTQAVAQVDEAQKITVQANGATDFSNTDMARVRPRRLCFVLHACCCMWLVLDLHIPGCVRAHLSHLCTWQQRIGMWCCVWRISGRR